MHLPSDCATITVWRIETLEARLLIVSKCVALPTPEDWKALIAGDVMQETITESWVAKKYFNVLFCILQRWFQQSTKECMIVNWLRSRICRWSGWLWSASLEIDEESVRERERKIKCMHFLITEYPSGYIFKQQTRDREECTNIVRSRSKIGTALVSSSNVIH